MLKIGIFILFAAISLSHSEDITFDFTLDTDDIQVSQWMNDDVISIPGGVVPFEDGNPSLQGIPYTLLLPQGSSITDVTVDVHSRVTLDGEYDITPVNCLVFSRPFASAERSSVYLSSTPFPASPVDQTTCGNRTGFRLGSFTLVPFSYSPLTGELSVITSATVTVECSQDPEVLDISLTPRQINTAAAGLQNIVHNPSRVADYAPAVRPATDGDPVWVAIGLASFETILQPLVDHRNQYTGESEYVTVEWIEANYSGWDTQEKIRNYLKDQFYSHSLVYALMVGDYGPTTRISWLYYNGTGDYLNDVVDHYYMDLDGTWEDLWVGYPSSGVPGSDGKYDTFSGSLEPEIYTGRIKVDNLSAIGDPIEMLNDYIERNHVWRMNGGPDPLTALCYVDDDWAGWGASYRNSMQLLYPNTILVNDIYGTNGTDYLETRLPDAYVWISPFVHSGPNTHYWAQGPTTTWDEIVPANPQAHFYNLFACSNARFTTTRCMGSVYAFCTSSGLASVGSTKTGSMLQFTHFYYPMGLGASIGEAYKDWWDFIANNGLSQDERSWHLGMVILGDPSLMPAMHMLGIEDQSTETDTPSGLIIAENPCQSELVLTYDEAEKGTVELYDTSGRLVASGTLEDSSCTLSLSSIQTGFYIVKVTAAGISTCASVVILR